MRRLFVTIGVWVILGTLFFLPRDTSFAIVTEYRSAQTITSDGDPPYTNLANCSTTDGQTCDREEATSFGNLYFWDFGDFGIPEDSTINDVRLRVIGKSTTAPYVGVSAGREYSSNCQLPSTLWQMGSLLGSEISVFTSNSIVPSVGSLSCLSYENVKENNFIFRINWSGAQPWSANIDNFEIAFDYTPSAPPEPFLDLPWDYGKKGKKFEEVALKINTFFDHKYPFLCCNSLVEPEEIFNFRNEFTDIGYSSHDGYDWGTSAFVDDGDPVLAAAAGVATFTPEASSGGAGNMIKIDHGNGYQTWYEHMYFDDHLAVKTTTGLKQVEQGERIGTVGHTGNCYVEYDGRIIRNSTDCAHIHFTVIQDKEFTLGGVADFSDNKPDGLTDPFGWQPDRDENEKDPDPWETYSFPYDGKQRIGNKSYYLWTTRLPGVKETITPKGGTYELDEDVKVEIDPNTFLDQAKLLIEKNFPVKISDEIWSIGPAIDITIKSLEGDLITQLTKPIKVVWFPFQDTDVSRFKLGTLKIYSSQDGVNWQEEAALDNYHPGAITASVDHLTYFVLAGERKDLIPPVTILNLTGDAGQENKFRSDVSFSLTATDSADVDPAGVKHTSYKESEGEWLVYTDQVLFSNEGNYALSFYSSDYDNNIEAVKETRFSIDKTPPEVTIEFDLPTKDIIVTGADSSGSASVVQDRHWLKSRYTVTDDAGNSLILNALDIEVGKLRTFTLKNLSYSNSESFDVDRNILEIHFQLDRGKNINTLIQTFYQKGKEVVILSYKKSSDKTKVFLKEKGKDKLVQELPGIKILQLHTDKGTLRYRY